MWPPLSLRPKGQFSTTTMGHSDHIPQDAGRKGGCCSQPAGPRTDLGHAELQARELWTGARADGVACKAM